MERILVVSPHPDDESIGCGGTLRRHVLEGSEVRVIFLTSGERGGHGWPLEETARVRQAEAHAAAKILGVRGIEFWGEPDGACRAHPRVVERLRATLTEWKPAVVYVTHEQEMHADHRAAARIVRRALAGRRPRNAPSVLTYEVWTPMLRMDQLVDISLVVDDKLAAIRAYASQCAVMRFDDAALGLSRYRGEMHSWPGGDYAEAFGAMHA